jgi:hypothetical protein
MGLQAECTLRDARAEYLHVNGLPPDGGYDDRWVRVRIGPIPLAFLNTEGRRRAVLLHDPTTCLRATPPTSSERLRLEPGR